MMDIESISNINAPLEIGRFENSELISNEALGDYIYNNVPLEHLTGCPSIEYNPAALCFQEYPNALGVYNTQTHEITINANDSLEGVNGMLETVSHEIGHNAHSLLIEESPHLANYWENLHQNSISEYSQNGSGFISEYATTNVYEDFAECYAKYIRDPEALAFLCPDKYAFMDKFVFHGSNGDALWENINTNDACVDMSNFRCFDIMA